MLSFHVKFVQTDGWTDRGKTICPQSFNIGHKKSKANFILNKVPELVHCKNLNLLLTPKNHFENNRVCETLINMI